MGKHLLATAFLAVVPGSYLPVQAQHDLSRTNASSYDQTPRIIVTSQPDAALSVNTSSRWATPDRMMLDLFIVVKNNYEKLIRAYTVHLDFQPQEGRKDACLIENIYSPGKVLKIAQSDGKSRFIGIEKKEPAPAIEVSIDFIEFGDGSTWGQDRCQAAEYLAGSRAGGKAAIEWFQNLLKEKGPEAVVATIREGSVSVEKPYNFSARWGEGFGRGVEAISLRVTEAYRKQGLEEVEVVLRKPYDASGVNQ